jgi:GntR family transcriptional regulator, vanillate catabolism transcriptional regulator
MPDRWPRPTIAKQTSLYAGSISPPLKGLENRPRGPWPGLILHAMRRARMTPVDLPADSSSQTERVVHRLRELLLSGHFPPGSRLAELTLVPLLKASRTPVRLALERVAHQGLIEALPGGGFRTCEFTLADMADAIEIRGVLEGTAARLAAERLTSTSELDSLRLAHFALEHLRAEDPETLVQYLDGNMRFHAELWRLAKSHMLKRALEAVGSLPFAEPGALVFGGPRDAEDVHERNRLVAFEQHRAIVEAIERREGTRAEFAAREHARLARSNLERALQDRHLLRQVRSAPLIAQSVRPPAAARTKRAKR